MKVRIAVSLAYLMLCLSTARAQSTVLTVVATDASSRVPVAGVHVLVPSLRLDAVTDSTGRARFGKVLAGLVDVVVNERRFAPASIKVVLGLNDTTEVLVELRPRGAVLDTVHVRAVRDPEYLAEFYNRKRLGLGHFLTTAQLDSLKFERLADLVSSRFTGLRSVWQLNGASVTLESTRGYYSLGGDHRSQTCSVRVYVDDMLATALDLGSLRGGDVGAVEYYSNAPPVQYTRAGAACGVLVVWTRR